VQLYILFSGGNKLPYVSHEHTSFKKNAGPKNRLNFLKKYTFPDLEITVLKFIHIKVLGST